MQRAVDFETLPLGNAFDNALDDALDHGNRSAMNAAV
jgi:hypothetical protein